MERNSSHHYSTLISVNQLQPLLGNPDIAVIDCRFVLKDPAAGRKSYDECHIPGAVYAHLDEDLSGTIIPGVTGRHPLPPPDAFMNRLSSWGVDSTVQVVAYDEAAGDMAAARLWWMLRWLGHDRVAVLDGGLKQWQAHKLPTRSGEENRPPRLFTGTPDSSMTVSAADVELVLGNATYRLIDARNTDTFLGTGPSFDPVNGHIPGAVCAPRTENIGCEGTFKSEEELRAHYAQLLGSVPVERTILYCGSGVTAAHNALAIAHAGLGLAKLYPGSFSEWITNPSRPVAT